MHLHQSAVRNKLHYGEMYLGAVSLTTSESKDWSSDGLDILVETNMLNLHLCKLA